MYFGKVCEDPRGERALVMMEAYLKDDGVDNTYGAMRLTDRILASENVAKHTILRWKRWWFPFEKPPRLTSVVYALCPNRHKIAYIGKTRQAFGDRWRIHQCKNKLVGDESFVAMQRFNDYWIDRVEAWLTASLDPEWNLMFPTCATGKPLGKQEIAGCMNVFQTDTQTEMVVP